jgi:hypothetical protein
MTQNLTDLTNVIDQSEGEMHARKEFAIDANCNMQLSDETIENQLFETSKSRVT